MKLADEDRSAWAGRSLPPLPHAEMGVCPDERGRRRDRRRPVQQAGRRGALPLANAAHSAQEYRQGASITPRQLGQLPRRTPRPSHSSVPTGANAFSVVVDAFSVVVDARANSGCMAELGGACAREAQSGGEMAARRGLIFPSKVRDPFFANTVGVAQMGFALLQHVVSCGYVTHRIMRFDFGLDSPQYGVPYSEVWRA